MSDIKTTILAQPDDTLVGLMSASLPGEGQRQLMDITATLHTDEPPRVSIHARYALDSVQLRKAIALLQRFETELADNVAKHCPGVAQ